MTFRNMKCWNHTTCNNKYEDEGTMSDKKNDEIWREVRIKFEIENLTILDTICTYKGIKSRHDFINDLLNREFANLKDKSIKEIINEIKKNDV